MQALLDELAAEFGTAKVFRPYRDVRFSNDKTPYKTHQGAVVHHEGAAPAPGTCRCPPTACGSPAAAGGWSRDQVARYRRAVDDDVQGPRLEAEVERLAPRVDIDGDRLVRVPAGYAADDRRLDLLGTRSLHATRAWEPADWLHDPRRRSTRPRRLAGGGRAQQWLADNVGATTAPPDRRR